MFYRFEIEKEFFLKNYDYIIGNLKKYKADKILKYIHVIVPELKISDIEDKIKNDIDINRGILFYSSYEDQNEYSFPRYINKNELYNTKISQDILERLYIQEVKGYVARDLNYNKIVKLTNEYDFIIKDENLCLGNMKTGWFENYNVEENIYIGIYGKCKYCLNCLCDHSKKRGNIKFLIDINECKFKKEMHNKIPKEVKEVTYEQYNHIIELLTEVLKQSDFNSSVILSEIDKIKGGE